MPELDTHPEPPPADLPDTGADVTDWLFEHQVPLFLLLAAVVMAATGYGY